MAAPPTHPGDTGSSFLVGGRSLPKDAAVFEALGVVDELSAALGVARAELSSRGHGDDAETLREVERVLIRVGAEIAAAPEPAASAQPGRLSETDLAKLDDLERELQAGVKHPRGFVLPGASSADALLHVARSVCRTAERRIVTCVRGGASHLAPAQRYLNRLSSCLYWLALRYGAEV